MDTKLLRKISYGLYVVGSTKEGRLNGQIANTVFQISSDPVTVGISLNRNNLTNEFVKASKVFSVSVLPSSAPLDFIGNFGFKSGRDTDKYQSVSFKQGETGAPILLENTLGYLEAEVISSLEVETHTVFIGKVVQAEILNNEEEPLTYSYYQQLKRGIAPKKAPDNSTITQLTSKPETSKEVQKMQKFECVVCGYIYDPAVGDPDSGIAPGTTFADLPEDWVCPTCGVSKDQFEPAE